MIDVASEGNVCDVFLDGGCGERRILLTPPPRRRSRPPRSTPPSPVRAAPAGVRLLASIA